MPALTAITRAMLSFLVRPFTVGTVIGGSLDAESPAVPDAVLDAVPRATATGVPNAGAVAGAGSVDEAATLPSGGICSPACDGRASLLAAHASAAISGRVSIGKYEYLLNRYECISL